ncbi:protein of unknown function (plasmid) [Candidatus Methylocalor cossyra]|uniref:Uncharacterized protein n=1 Tax=Candidatus Methylocalor cossyra TaxID=3108543 RepID=A0ABP1CDG8_9GAMM
MRFAGVRGDRFGNDPRFDGDDHTGLVESSKALETVVRTAGGRYVEAPVSGSADPPKRPRS